MTSALSAILRPVGFIFDPVPRVDRHPIDVTIEVSYPDDWLSAGDVDWSPLDTAPDRNPASSPPPYNWATQHAWPTEGWGPA